MGLVRHAPQLSGFQVQGSEPLRSLLQHMASHVVHRAEELGMSTARMPGSLAGSRLASL